MPASTSSNTSVGTSSRSAITLRHANIVRESSPPDAVLASEAAFCPGDGDRRSSTRSAPAVPSSGDGSSSTPIVAPGMPSCCSSRSNAAASAGAAVGPAPRDGRRPTVQLGLEAIHLLGELREPLVRGGERRPSGRRTPPGTRAPRPPWRRTCAAAPSGPRGVRGSPGADPGPPTAPRDSRGRRAPAPRAPWTGFARARPIPRQPYPAGPHRRARSPRRPAHRRSSVSPDSVASASAARSKSRSTCASLASSAVSRSVSPSSGSTASISRT